MWWESVSRQTKDFVGLDAHLPMRVCFAVFHNQLCVRDEVGAIHRLKKEVLKRQMLESRHIHSGLRINDFQLVSRSLYEIGASFWAYANPIDVIRRANGSVRLDRDLKMSVVQSGDQRGIQL